MEKNDYFMDVGKYRKDKDYVKIWRRRGLVAGIILSLVFVIVQAFGIMSEYEKSKGIEILSQFSEYYEFKPNSLFAAEALRRYGSAATSVVLENESKVYTEYLTKWEKESDVDILRLQLYGYYGKDDIRIYSYVNQKPYEIAWDDFSLPLEEGRWFEGTEDEVICVQGDDYEIGDLIKIEDKYGNSFIVTVVGKTCYSYLPNNTLDVVNGVHNTLYKPSDDLEIFLFNPRSLRNEKTELTQYNTTMIKTNDEIFLRENSQYGTFTSVDLSLKRDRVNYVLPFAEMMVGLFFFLLLFVVMIRIKEDKWMLLWIWIAGVLGCFVGSVVYYDAICKVLITMILCTVFSLIWLLIHKNAGKQTVSDEIEVVVLQKEEEINYGKEED